MTTLRIPAVLIALAAAMPASAGVFVDWWVPVDQHCLLNPDSDETKKAAADDVDGCRTEHTTHDEAGESRVDWKAVMSCMESRGWERKARSDWDAWNTKCANKADVDAHTYVVITEELAHQYMAEKAVTPNQVGDEVILTVPPAMLGRMDDERTLDDDDE